MDLLSESVAVISISMISPGDTLMVPPSGIRPPLKVMVRSGGMMGFGVGVGVGVLVGVGVAAGVGVGITVGVGLGVGVGVNLGAGVGVGSVMGQVNPRISGRVVASVHEAISPATTILCFAQHSAFVRPASGQPVCSLSSWGMINVGACSLKYILKSLPGCPW